MTTLTKFPGTLAHYQDQMIDVFSGAVPAKKFEVYLFGSRARGDEEEGSDAAEKVANQCLSLPMSPYLQEYELDLVVSTITKTFAN